MVLASAGAVDQLERAPRNDLATVIAGARSECDKRGKLFVLSLLPGAPAGGN